ncbi:MAG: hypothetical protein LRY67_03080 [Gammaproteobacteria bacterium]|nr:hypothetical protein [Gammaproteobacteria bacterium]
MVDIKKTFALPCILVIGMHRSGTSAMTGAIASLGLGLPMGDDLMQGGTDNPIHYESRCLTAFNDELLHFLGLRWDFPADLPENWENSPSLNAWYERAKVVFHHAFKHAKTGIVWKDPRNCLLLPFWKKILNQDVKVLFIWRHPLEVARSLEYRNQFPVQYGLALWEQYNFLALTALQGLDVYLFQYDTLFQHHDDWFEMLAKWCTANIDHNQFARTELCVNRNYRHHHEENSDELTENQRSLLALIRDLDPMLTSFPKIEYTERSTWVRELFRPAKNFSTQKNDLQKK